MLCFSRNKQLSVIIFSPTNFYIKVILMKLLLLLLHLHLVIFLVLVSCQMSLQLLIPLRLSSAITTSFPLFLSFEHSQSFLFFSSQICSFTSHLKFLTIATHLIYRILTFLKTIFVTQFCLNLKITRNKLCLKKTYFSFPNRQH